MSRGQGLERTLLSYCLTCLLSSICLWLLLCSSSSSATFGSSSSPRASLGRKGEKTEYFAPHHLPNARRRRWIWDPSSEPGGSVLCSLFPSAGLVPGQEVPTDAEEKGGKGNQGKTGSRLPFLGLGVQPRAGYSCSTGLGGSAPLCFPEGGGQEAQALWGLPFSGSRGHLLGHEDSQLLSGSISGLALIPC